MTNPLYIDTSTSSAFLDSVGLNPTVSPSALTQADRFWASDKASIFDTTFEVLELNLSTASLINRIQFDAAKYPQTISVQYTIDNSQNWLPVLDAYTGQPIQPTILKSFPVVLPSVNAVTGHQHPQHDYDGHWEKFNFRVVSGSMQKIRFVIQRNANGSSPVDSTGARVPYSVALQNIEVGYEIAAESDIPREVLEPTSNQTSKVFANTSDIFKSNLGFSKRTRFVNSLLQNTDTSAPYIWKSEPQPFPQAVVNVFGDLRDSEGLAQIIDRIFIDPIYEGPHITAYYSNDSVVTSFDSSRRSLTNLDVTLTNASVDPSNLVLNLGTFGEVSSPSAPSQEAPTLPNGTLNFSAQASLSINSISSLVPYFVTVNNQTVGLDVSLPWWIGLQFKLTGNPLNPTADAVRHPFLSCNAFEIGYYSVQDPINPGVSASTSYVYLSTSNGDTNVVAYNLDINQPVQLVAASHDGMLHLSVQQSDITASNDIPLTVDFSSAIPANLFIGTDTSNARYSNIKISAFILKQEILPSDDFLDNSLNYSRVSLFPSDSELGKKNALIRFDPTKLSSNADSGLIGGPAFSYDNLMWTPIPREYAMHRGYMVLPPTKAKFWKLEITNLCPEVYDKYIPVTRQVKTFPASVIQDYIASNHTGAARQSADDLGTNVQASLAYAQSYIDIPSFVGTGRDETEPSPTEVYVADDYVTGARLRQLGTDWRYQNWHSSVTAPRFSSTQQHEYDIQAISQTADVSFFAGLRQIKFLRSQKTSPQDFPIIEEFFLDGDAINDSGSWQLVEGGFTSATSGYARSTSVVIPTQRSVRAVQFATQQSDAKYISVDGEFNAGTYDPNGVNSWASFGDARILGLTQINNASDSSLLVTRQSHGSFYADIKLNFAADPAFPAFPTGGFGAITKYDPVRAPSLVTNANSTKYGDMTSATASSQFSGGISSSAVVAPYGGRVYAAAKVTATQSLTEPLWMQIIDADTGAVVSEQPSNVGKNDIQEWYTGVDMGDYGAVVGDTWGTVAGHLTYPSFSDNFTRSNSTTLGTMSPSGQPWSTSGTPLQIVSNAAKVVGTGALSQFDSLTPWGDWTVTLGTAITTGTHSASVPLLDLGGVYLNNDGTLETTNTSVTAGTLTNTLTAGRVYRFQFIPTAVATGASLDANLFPYSIVLYENGVYVQTFSFTRAFSTVRALMGAVNQTFSSMTWTPGIAQPVSLSNFQPTVPVPSLSAVVPTQAGDSSYTWRDSSGHNWYFSGYYTYGTTRYATTIQSLAPGGSFLSAPSGLAVTPVATGGVFTSGTYFWKVTAINAQGETTVSSEVSSAIVNNGSANLTWSAVTGAIGYKIYRSATTGTEILLATVYGLPAYTDTGISNAGGAAMPSTNTTSSYGTVSVVGVNDQYGALSFNVTQMPSGISASAVPIAYLDYNPQANYTLALMGDGKIINLSAPVSSGNSVSGADGTVPMFAQASMTIGYPPPSIASFNPLSGPIHIRYTPANRLSSTFKNTWGIVGSDTQAIVFIQNATVIGVYSGKSIWTTTVRGLGGAASGTGGGQYFIAEGFSWSPDGALVATNGSAPLWTDVTNANTATYGLLSNSTAPSVKSLAIRIIQKAPTDDYWFVQSAALFWDPVLWEFSSDAGGSWWRAIDVRNDPLAVLPFPIDRSEYKKFMWRVTSYSPDVTVSLLKIRPWYEGEAGSMPVRPTQLPFGPNLVPTDYYSRIEADPLWNTWDNPIPRWWWDGFKSTTL